LDINLINNNRASDSVRQEVMQVITLELKIIYEKDGCRTVLAKNYTDNRKIILAEVWQC
jgi:hypothetical protein